MLKVKYQLYHTHYTTISYLDVKGKTKDAVAELVSAIS